MFLNRLGLALGIVAASLAAAGCAPRRAMPQRTQLEIRELQTRTYDSKSTRTVMKALINALQDDGFMVRNADKDLGFISASKDLDVEDPSAAFMAQLLSGENARYPKNSVIEASVNVSEFGAQTKVRAVFQARVQDNYGAPVSTSVVDDPKYYEDFFYRVDKSLFIEKQGL